MQTELDTGQVAKWVPQQDRTPRRVSDVLVDVLSNAGIDLVFGLPGGPISPLHDALLDRPNIQVITTRHESGALFAAAGYAQTTGRLGVALVTSGPGVLNAMTGLASAQLDGLPLLLLVGEVPKKAFGRGALQDGSAGNLNIVEIARHVTKLAVQLGEPSHAAPLLSRAIATALSGRRGPVVVTLPMDVCAGSVLPSEIALDVSTTLRIAPRTIERTAQLLTRGQRNALFVGAGVRAGDGPQCLLALAERLQVPVLTTPKGKGVFPENHPLSLGVFGLGGHPSTVRFLEGGIDVLLAMGTSFNDVATDGWSPLLRPRDSLIHVDIDARQIGRAMTTTLGVAAPADAFCRQLAACLPAAAPRDFGGVLTHTDPCVVTVGDQGLISPQRALWEIQQVLPPDAIYAGDSGEHLIFAIHYLKVQHPQGFIAMTGLGSMGSSIGAAIGAKLAQPDRQVAAICGDGCFAMNAFEIGTAVASRVPIVVFVFNDQRLGMVENGHEAVYGRRPDYPTGPMEIADLARSLGAEAEVITRPGELLTSTALRGPRRVPLVLDVRIDPSIRMPRRDRFDPAGTSRTKILN